MSRPDDRPIMDDFPFPTSISLDPLIRVFEDAAQDPDSPWHPMAEAVMVEVETVPEIRGKVQADGLAQHESLIARMMTMVFPESGPGSQIGAAMEPYRMAPVFNTEEARRLGVFTPENLFHKSNVPSEMMRAGIAMSAYQYVLQAFYGVTPSPEPDLVVTIATEEGLKRHLQFIWSSEFLEIELRGELPELNDEDLARILGDPLNIPLVTALLPPERFELTGFGVVTATDVTPREVVSRLKDDLIQKDALATPERVDLIQERIRNLVRSPDAVVGFIAFDISPEIDRIDWARPVGRSLLFDGGEAPQCSMKGHSSYANALDRHQPIILQNLAGDNVTSGYEAHLAALGFESFVLCPLVLDEKVIGLMELASPRAGELTAYSAMLLMDVAPLFTTAIQRTVEEQSDRIEAVIKKNYTSIHPAVEWRFKQAAQEIMAAEGSETEADLPEIVFEDIYPLYGLSDIRGSSARRNQAIRADLVHQLELALAAVSSAAVAEPLMILDELAHRIRGYIARIDDVMGSEDEQTALGFLAREVEPLFDRLSSLSDGANARVGAYRDSLDSRLGVVYRQRRAFEDSVSKINNLVGHVIDSHEESAQGIVPHLFERFKTDGVDYNLYVGETIADAGSFHPLFLKELRLWQLALHCKVEWAASAQKADLEVPMDLTHLILVQDVPLSIRFRADEKRFDVDGAYNIRYEIVKKRIDKATVRGTGERLTQPGMIAIVYSQPHEAAEYRTHVDYLRAAGYIEGEIEEVELDDLQGVYGLKALRVKVAVSQPSAEPSDDGVPDAVRLRLSDALAQSNTP